LRFNNSCFIKATEYFRKALDSDLKTYGETHPSTAANWNSLGNAWYYLKKCETAVDYYKKALNVLEKTLGKDHPYTKKTIPITPPAARGALFEKTAPLNPCSIHKSF
jgi:tetratricopeptide (TPR) repeat protein